MIQFSGYNESVCAKDPYDEDDKEADAIYDNVDNRLDERRQVYRERKLQDQLAAYRKERPKIQAMFAHLKQDLLQVRLFFRFFSLTFWSTIIKMHR